MRDRREDILSRLETIFTEVPGVLRSARNIEDVSGGAAYRPAIIMHDAAEERVMESRRPRGATKELMSLKPQIFVLWGDRAKLVATKVNEIRRDVIRLIWTDSIIRGIIGTSTDADILYTGCGLDTFSGETREAKMQISFDFIYLLDVNDLS